MYTGYLTENFEGVLRVVVIEMGTNIVNEKKCVSFSGSTLLLVYKRLSLVLLDKSEFKGSDVNTTKKKKKKVM